MFRARLLGCAKRIEQTRDIEASLTSRPLGPGAIGGLT
jgi:hypothetical protein